MRTEAPRGNPLKLRRVFTAAAFAAKEGEAISAPPAPGRPHPPIPRPMFSSPLPRVCLVAGCAALLLPTSPLVAATIEKTIEQPDPAMLKRNDYFGYSPEYVAKYFTTPREFTYDLTGAAIPQPAPPPGVHPRVLFGPDELPAIRARLESTKPGRMIRDSIRKVTSDLLTGPNAKYAAQYAALAAGDETVPIHAEISIPYTVLYESFRALLDNDQAAAVKAAAAVTTIAKIDRRVLAETREKVRAKNPGAVTDFEQVGQAATQEGTLGLMYDFCYPAMTPEQRDTVRSVIAEASTGMGFVGSEGLRVSNTSSSNHIPWIARLIYLPTSIEGEKGYDAATYRRCVEALKWFYGIGIFPSGDAFEGWGKNFLIAEHAWIAAKRGEKLFALTPVRNAFRSYFVQAMNPWGNNFTFYDSSGGTGNKLYRQSDILVYKALFPADPALDFVYRNNVSPDYKEFGNPVNTRNAFGLTEGLCMALFAAEYDGTKTWEQAQAPVVAALPTTSFCDDTGNLIARSDWTREALYLNYLNRSVMGGHLYSDRGHFSLYALGRYWGIYRPLRQVPEAYQPKNRTGVMVGDEGVSTLPGKCVAFDETPQAAFVATDLKPSYDYISNYIFPNVARTGAVKAPFSPNDFRLHRSPLPWMNIRLDEMPNWQTSRIPDPAPGAAITGRPAPGAWWRKRDVPYEKAFRTAGLVRGAHPYVLVVDDINRDGTEREYAWGMTLSDDVELQKTELVPDPRTFRADAILAEKGRPPAQSRRLMVRMVQARNLPTPAPAAIEPITSANPPQKDVVIPKLTFRARGVEPGFKTLIVPLPPGEEPPKTAWSADGTQLTITWPDQSDTIRFTPGPDGRTRLTIRRGDQVVLAQK